MRPLSPLTLKILVALAEGPMHSYAIVRRAVTDNLPEPLDERPVYKALPRLMREGLIEFAPGASGSPVSYRLTPKAIRLLRSERVRLEDQARLIRARLP